MLRIYSKARFRSVLRPTQRAFCESAFEAVVASDGNISFSEFPISLLQASDSTLYLDPICLQMDQSLLKCGTPEELLTMLTTHRGVLFVHNLVTALSLLADMSQESIPFSKAQKFKYPGQLERVDRDRLLSDPRYVLLIRDLLEKAPYLDLESIRKIMADMRKLDHCHFQLFGALLRRVYSVDLGQSDIATAVSIGQDFEWAGFSKAQSFYGRLSDLVEKDAHNLSKKDSLNALLMFSRLGKLYPSVMDRLVGMLPYQTQCMTERELGISAIAASEFGAAVPTAPAGIASIANELMSRENMFKSGNVRHWIRVGIALRRVNVMNSNFLNALWIRSLQELRACAQQRERMEPSISSISDLGSMVESCAYFGQGSASDLTDVIFPHLMDHLDIVTEETAIRILFGAAMFPASVTPRSAPTISLLIRKVASATDSWEKHKLKIFSIWITKIMQFDFVDSEFRKLVIDSSLSHYLIARRGYGVPYPEDSLPLFEAFKMASEDAACGEVLFNEWIPDSPFNADILIPEMRIAILVLSRFSIEGNPVGSDLLEIKNVESLGWKVLPIDRKKLRENFSLAKDSLLTHTYRSAPS